MAGTSGRSGRRPVPTRLKMLHGNPGKRRLNDREPQPEARLPKPPEHLTDEAKKEWRRAGKLLLGMGLVSDLDRAALAVANKAMEQTRSFLVEFGMTPASRTRVHAERSSAANPLDKFLRREGESR